MALDAEREEILEAAIARIPKVAWVIATLPVRRQAEALRIAERSYRLTALDLRLGPRRAEWVSAVMHRLRAETKSRSTENQILLSALYREIMHIGAD
jgi:hypothetical protein